MKRMQLPLVQHATRTRKNSDLNEFMWLVSFQRHNVALLSRLLFAKRYGGNFSINLFGDILFCLCYHHVFRVECPRPKSTCAIKTLRNVINDLKVLCRWFTMVNGTEIHLHMTILKCIVNFHLPAHFLICCIGKPIEIDYRNMIETQFYGRHFKALEANAFTTERIVVMFDEKSSSTPNRKSCGYIELFWT